MANAIRDNNHVPALLGVLNTDGTTLIPIKIDADTGGVMTDTTSIISYTPTTYGPRDANFVHCLMAQDENGIARPVNVNSSGAILIDQ